MYLLSKFHTCVGTHICTHMWGREGHSVTHYCCLHYFCGVLSKLLFSIPPSHLIHLLPPGFYPIWVRVLTSFSDEAQMWKPKPNQSFLFILCCDICDNAFFSAAVIAQTMILGILIRWILLNFFRSFIKLVIVTNVTYQLIGILIFLLTKLWNHVNVLKFSFHFQNDSGARFYTLLL